MEDTIPDWKQRQLDRDLDSRLEWHEKEIKKGVNMVAKSIKAIHDDQLYRRQFATFDDYCEQRLNLSKARAYQILNAQSVRELLGSVMQDAPQLSDNAALALKDSPVEKVVEIVKSASTKGKVTKEAILHEIGKKPEKPKIICTCPNCGHQY